MKRLVSFGFFFLILCLSVMICIGPKLMPNEIQKENNLDIVFPQTSTEVAGGQSIRITIILKDYDDKPIEGAFVEAKLWTPDGEMYATLPCSDVKAGRYLADYVALPLRNSQGLWRITARAVLENGMVAEAEGHFLGQNSYSERLQHYFGFWIDLTDLFPYNISNAEDPLLKSYSYENGGYVLLAKNMTTTQINNSFVFLDVHWRQMDFPEDTLSAANYVLNLAGPHRIALDISASDLNAEKDTFLGSQSWHVTGWWNPDNALGNPRPDAPLDWMIFHCPGSKTVWTILITSNEIKNLHELQLIRESFECSLD